MSCTERGILQLKSKLTSTICLAYLLQSLISFQPTYTTRFISILVLTNLSAWSIYWPFLDWCLSLLFLYMSELQCNLALLHLNFCFCILQVELSH